MPPAHGQCAGRAQWGQNSESALAPQPLARETISMRIAGVTDSDNQRLAVDVARERGIEITPFQRRPGELWGAYAVRMGIARRETARAWWELAQTIDRAYGLPRDPEPDWTNEWTVAAWDEAPWLTRADHDALRQGQPLGGALVTRLAPWEHVQPAVERVMVDSPPAASLDDLVARSDMVSAALAVLLPQPEQWLPMQAARAGMSPSSVAKYLKKGFQLAWDNKKLILKTAGKKVIPVYNAVSTAQDVYTAVQWLEDHAVDVKYLPEREYQIATNSFIYRWPNGDVTTAPPPAG